MLAARDQENLVHAHQQAAAGKPLNQGIKQLQPKTPGNRTTKTPFKVALNDENAPTGFPGQKTALKKGLGKGNENIQTIKKDGKKLDKDAFITPVGPRVRAPLGMKTTNAKAKAFETPAAGQAKPLQATKRPSTIGTKRKSKIVVAQPEPIQADVLVQEDEDDVPDIEYMPPKPVELADPPEEITYDDTFPQFQGRNMFKGWSELYGPPVGKDGLTDKQRALEARYAREAEAAQRSLDAQINETYPIDPEAEADREVERLIRSHYSSTTKPSQTETAKAAASALNPNLTKPTLSSQQKSKPNTTIIKSKKPTPAPTNPSPMRHTALAATSRTTVGYSKGRNVSGKLQHAKTPAADVKPKTIDNDGLDMSPTRFRSLFGDPPVGSRMWYRLHGGGEGDAAGGLGIDNDDDDGERKRAEEEDERLTRDVLFGIEGVDDEVFQL